MIQQRHQPCQLRIRNVTESVTPPLETWPLRVWLSQAQHLYRIPEAQRLAVLHHVAILRRHAVTAERVLWLDALGRDLDGEDMR